MEPATEPKTKVTNPVVKNIQSPSRKNAINAMCAQCMGCDADSAEDGFRNLIRDCQSVNCAIYSFRPYVKG